MYSCKYVTANGEILDLSKRPYFLLADNELHNYEWEYEDNGVAITQVLRGKGIKRIPFNIYVYASSRQNAFIERNEVTTIFEKDIVANTPGRLYIGDYYMKGFIISSKKSEWVPSKSRMILSVELLTDNPIWISEKTTMYRKDTYSDIESGSLDYPYNFPYNYTAVTAPSLINNSLSEAGFIIRIYGPVQNPIISISGSNYQVNCNVTASEQLVITSSGTERSIYLLSEQGNKTNMFSNRNVDYNNFKKIPVGENTVSWNFGFDFDITLLIERGEPIWI